MMVKRGVFDYLDPNLAFVEFDVDADFSLHEYKNSLPLFKKALSYIT